MSSSAVLQLKNVTKKIKGKTIIDQLSFEVPKGEVFGFLGPNGAGKTTTIRMIVGLMGMTDGEVLIKGNSVKTNFQEAMKHVGAIVENPEMYKFLSGYKNLIHFARMNQGITKERIEAVIKLVGLEKRIHDKVKTYSLGMRQRLGVAQALLHNPSLLILDEPTNGLDPAGIRELRDYLRELAEKEGISILVSSHLLSEMELMCDRVAIIQNGRLVNIQDLREKEADSDDRSLQKVAFVVDNPEQAKEILSDIKGLAVLNGGIEVSVTYEQIAAVNALLVQSGIKVFGIRPVTKTLEDKFLEMTRGEGIV